jgi:hypothetical protein
MTSVCSAMQEDTYQEKKGSKGYEHLRVSVGRELLKKAKEKERKEKRLKNPMIGIKR